jgi:Flp pilus assembly secretin CpaC
MINVERDAMRTISHCLRLILAAGTVGAASFGCVGYACADEPIIVEPPPAQTITLPVGTARIIRTTQPYTGANIASPEIADILPQTDQSAELIARSTGQTTVLFLDEHKNLLSSILVRVIPTVESKTGETETTFEDIPGRVRIYNGSSLSAVSFYRCNQNNCEFMHETPPRIAPPQVTTTNTVTTPRGQVTKTTTEEGK